MTRILLVILLCQMVMYTFEIYSQPLDFTVPRYSLRTTDDYARYRPDAINAMQWLLQNPVSAQVEKRKEVSAFVMGWLAGTEEIKLTLKPEILGDLLIENGFLFSTELVVVYMSSMALEMLLSEIKPEDWAIQLAGVGAMLEAYRYVKNSSRSTHLINLQNLKNQGKLEEWVRCNVQYANQDIAGKKS